MKPFMILFVLTAASTLKAQSDGGLVDFRKLLESIGSSSESSSIPTPEAISARLDSVEDALKGAPAEDIRPLVSAAAGCLNSVLTSARKDCLLALSPVAILRFDSAILLSPCVPRVVALLDDDDPSIRTMAALILATMHPHPPTELIGVVMPRIADSKKSPDDVMSLIALLLATDSTSTPVIRAVLNVTKLRADRGITGRVLERFGVARCTNELALNFISESLASPDSAIRDAAVSSLLSQSGIVLRRFQSRLTQIAVDPDENPRIKATAGEVLRLIR
jgi:hypothetical protein